MKRRTTSRAFAVTIALSIVACIDVDHRDLAVGPTASGGTGGAGAEAGKSAGGDVANAGGLDNDAGATASSGAGAGGESAGGAGLGGEGGAGDQPDPDPCLGVACSKPPQNHCASGTEIETYDSVGSCKQGTCVYTSHNVPCVCANDVCSNDPCVSVTCKSPPDSFCKDGSSVTSYAANGVCSDGSCNYTPQETPCEFGCFNGACKPDPCLSKTCNDPPGDECKDANTVTSYAANGTCSKGNCSYAPTDTSCKFGCANNACKPDPCLTLTCNSPPANKCKDGDTKTTYAASGTCANGSCSYAPTDTDCASNQTCGGAGVCSVCKADASCGATCTACGGSTTRCKDLGSTSKCVTCLTDADCSGATPSCNTTTNVCGAAPPSCNGLAKTCGPAGSTFCCASNPVKGGTFNRQSDPDNLTTVSNFKLDNYEISVGRFRKFVAAYSQSMIASGAGKNPNNPSDTGWSTAWNASLPADATALKSDLNCDPSGVYDNWTDAAGGAAAESLPINCLSWFVAEAFCIWDGGRLPTEAEWQYTTFGGSLQRAYPWGSASPDCTFANFKGANAGTDYCVSPGTGGTNRVGSESAKGDGFFGQSDLAGNVWEWTQDFYNASYKTPCNNCADLTTSLYHVDAGGAFDNEYYLLGNSNREAHKPLALAWNRGARCARAF